LCTRLEDIQAHQGRDCNKITDYRSRSEAHGVWSSPPRRSPVRSFVAELTRNFRNLRWTAQRGRGETSSMKALVKVDRAPGLQLTDVPDPVAGPGDVAVRVLRTGICGTDLHVESWDDWAAR